MIAELTVAEKLQALYQLQCVDSKIDEVRVIKGELPIELKDIEDELEGLVTRLQNSEDHWTGSTSRSSMSTGLSLS